MSVKKVKISELPQLPPDASGEGLFMPAADENNRSYRVPLSRYDNAKNEADKAASVAEKAAEGAMTATQEANDASDRVTDIGRDVGDRWMFANNQWTKLGGTGDGSAEEALAAANEVKNSRADSGSPGLAVGVAPDALINSPDAASVCVGFTGGGGYIGVNHLRVLTDLTSFANDSIATKSVFTVILNSTYRNVPTPKTGYRAIGVYGYMTMFSGFAFLVNFSNELNGAYRGGFVFSPNHGWYCLPLTEVPGAASTVAEDGSPAVETEGMGKEAELGKETFGTMENLTTGK